MLTRQDVSVVPTLARKPLARTGEWRDTSYRWMVTIQTPKGRVEIDYYTGIGWYTAPKTGGDPWLQKNAAYIAAGLAQADTHWGRRCKPKPPEWNDVIHCLATDADAINSYTPGEFCTEFGYGDDIDAGLAALAETQAQQKRLTAIGLDPHTLQRLAPEDY